MAIINQVMIEVLNVVERGLPGRDTTSQSTPTTTAMTTATTTSPAPTVSTTAPVAATGPTNSPLLFFVALGFGVVFTNLWIIVGVKYCFRYNARNRAIRNGEEVDPINLENMPTRPHRRRREKKLMTMDEVNERFPLTKYKTWVASRAAEGLPTEGGVTAAMVPSRAGSVREADEVRPASPTATKQTAASEPINISPPTNALGGSFGDESKSGEADVAQESPVLGEENTLEEVQTTASTVNKRATANSGEEDEDDDHIHTAVPPELLTNPGDSCAICIDTLEEDDDIRGLTCGHAFHAGCLDPWLTSRRACCPLCKADYYVPKPRPEGEGTEAERAARRSTRTPQPPASAWTGLRAGNPRLILPGRFMSTAAPPGDATFGLHRGADRRSSWLARRQAIGAQQTQASGALDGAAQNAEQAAPRRWHPNVSNPFRNMRMPTIPGRARQESTPEVPSPSQLESGTVA